MSDNLDTSIKFLSLGAWQILSSQGYLPGMNWDLSLKSSTKWPLSTSMVALVGGPKQHCIARPELWTISPAVQLSKWVTPKLLCIAWAHPNQKKKSKYLKSLKAQSRHNQIGVMSSLYYLLDSIRIFFLYNDGVIRSSTGIVAQARLFIQAKGRVNRNKLLLSYNSK